MLKIIKNPDKELFENVSQKVKDNEGYCPCKLIKNQDTFCPCKEFKEQITIGECHCGRFLKVE